MSGPRGGGSLRRRRRERVRRRRLAVAGRADAKAAGDRSAVHAVLPGRGRQPGETAHAQAQPGVPRFLSHVVAPRRRRRRRVPSAFVPDLIHEVLVQLVRSSLTAAGSARAAVRGAELHVAVAQELLELRVVDAVLVVVAGADASAAPPPVDVSRRIVGYGSAEPRVVHLHLRRRARGGRRGRRRVHARPALMRGVRVSNASAEPAGAAHLRHRRRRPRASNHQIRLVDLDVRVAASGAEGSP